MEVIPVLVNREEEERMLNPLPAHLVTEDAGGRVIT